METNDLIALWKTQDQPLQNHLNLNDASLRDMLNTKANSFLQKMIRYKSIGIVSFVMYILFLSFLLQYAFSRYSTSWNYFIISVTCILIINLKGLYDYIHHIWLARNIRLDNNVISIQLALSDIQFSIMKHERLMGLQFPFYTTFYLSSNWFPHQVGWGYIVFQIGLTAIFCGISIFFFFIHRPENNEKQWYQFFRGSGSHSITKALQLYRDILEFKTEK